MLTNMATLESMALDLAEKTGKPLALARAGVRIEMAKLAVAMGMPIETANAYLDHHGAGLRIVRKEVKAS